MSEPLVSLAERQADFMRAILDDSAPLPDGWGNRQAVGMSVYRGNYRGALMSALEDTYERTRRYVGEGPFERTAVHHLIAHPPASWTIDDAGEGFSETCAQLFGENPEVAELAWLEWTMLQVSTSRDCVPMTAADFGAATAGFDDGDWMELTVAFQPNANARLLGHNFTEMWNALAEDGLAKPDISFDQPKGCIVWREGEQPIFMAVEADCAQAFLAMQNGASYGDVIVLLAGESPADEAFQSAAMRAGEMLGTWLQEGMIISLKA